MNKIRAGRRPAGLWRVLSWLLVVQLFLTAPVAAAGYRAPRTAYGDPDLQGLWTNFSLTRLERPPGVTSLIVKDGDVAAVERALRAPWFPDPLGGQESEWWEDAPIGRINGQARSSWIFDPTNGKLPYSAEGRRLLDTARAKSNAADDPESRAGQERCLVPTLAAGTPPYMNSPYAANYQIVQTRDHVVLISEMHNEVRIVRLNAPHAPSTQRYWTGDSVGHWEKNTLVVDTQGFREVEAFRLFYYVSEDAKVTERFTRVSPTEIRYEFSVDDPMVFTQVWRGEMPFLATKGPLYEFACHEGNYGLANILSGARYEEAVARAAKATAPP